MNCNCLKSDVCKYRYNLISAVDGILNLRDGGTGPKWEDFAKVVRKHCHYRFEKEKKVVNEKPRRVRKFKKVNLNKKGERKEDEKKT